MLLRRIRGGNRISRYQRFGIFRPLSLALVRMSAYVKLIYQTEKDHSNMDTDKNKMRDTVIDSVNKPFAHLPPTRHQPTTPQP